MSNITSSLRPARADVCRSIPARSSVATAVMAARWWRRRSSAAKQPLTVFSLAMRASMALLAPLENSSASSTAPQAGPVVVQAVALQLVGDPGQLGDQRHRQHAHRHPADLRDGLQRQEHRHRQLERGLPEVTSMP